MTAFSELRDSAAFAALLGVSERLGRDPLQVQGTGSRSSIEADGADWVKVSGTRLAEAREWDLMVPVDADGMAAAMRARG